MTDVEQIRALIAEIEHGFNTNDAERSVAPFDPGAVAVGVTGVVSAGRDGLLAAHRAGYEGGLRDQYVRYELGDVRFLRDDVAIAHKRAFATDRDGNDLEVGHTMVALYVFVKSGGRWQISARQNTLVS